MQREASINGQGRQLFTMAIGVRADEGQGVPRRTDARHGLLNEDARGRVRRLLRSRRTRPHCHYRQQDGIQQFRPGLARARRACDGEQEIPRCRDGAVQRNQGQDARRSLHRLRQLHARLHAAYCRRRRVRRGWRLRAGRAGAAPASGAGAALGQPSAALAARRHGVNLHMFEALLALYEATKSEEVWYEITSELKAIERLFDYEQGYFAESYDDNWKPGGIRRRRPACIRGPRDASSTRRPRGGCRFRRDRSGYAAGTGRDPGQGGRPQSSIAGASR